ncbi:hypothetical protein ACJX0J_021539, partial [Zea mays]
ILAPPIIVSNIFIILIHKPVMIELRQIPQNQFVLLQDEFLDDMSVICFLLIWWKIIPMVFHDITGLLGLLSLEIEDDFEVDSNWLPSFSSQLYPHMLGDKTPEYD